MEQGVVADARSPRGWPRAAGLFGVVLATTVIRPGVLIAVPLLLLLGAQGFRGVGPVVAGILAGSIVVVGSRDGIWFAERAWSVLLGGGFLGLTMVFPAWSLSSRALGAVAGAGTLSGGILGARSDAWIALDTAISEGARRSGDATLSALSALRGGEALPPTVVAAFHEAAQAHAAVFPALIGLQSMAALGVAWWARTRLVGEGDQGLGPLRDFRFNDHLVWLLVGGLLLLLIEWGDPLARVGLNVVLFMGSLYALRGAAVFTFVSGGLPVFAYVMLALGLLLAWPIVLGVVVLIGVADTWVNFRSRAREKAG